MSCTALASPLLWSINGSVSIPDGPSGLFVIHLGYGLEGWLAFDLAWSLRPKSTCLHPGIRTPESSQPGSKRPQWP